MVLTDEQTMIRDSVRAFVGDAIGPRSRAFERDGGYPPDIFVTLADLGLMGMTVPEEAGGAGADYVSYVLAIMELAGGGGALSTIVSIQNSLIVNSLISNGTEMQKARWLSELVSGRVLGAFALTETDAGSDAAAISTRARRVEGGWQLDGRKQFITSGRIAGLALVIAVTDPQAGMTAFLVPTDTPGYYVEKVEHKLGQGASDTCAILFEGLIVPEDAVLGRIGEGCPMALANLEVGRLGKRVRMNRPSQTTPKGIQS